MYSFRRTSPPCPASTGMNTYDLVPGLPFDPEIQLSEEVFDSFHEKTVGNAEYYCSDCGFNWKKYQGREHYEKIKVIHAQTGGYPGPYFQVKIDFLKRTAEYQASDLGDALRAQHCQSPGRRGESFSGDAAPIGFYELG